MRRELKAGRDPLVSARCHIRALPSSFRQYWLSFSAGLFLQQRRGAVQERVVGVQVAE